MKRWKTAAVLFILLVNMGSMISCGAAEEVPTATAGPSLKVDPPPVRKSEVPRITAEELKARLDGGEAIVIADTRSKTLFDAKHIAGAISVPVNEVTSHLASLPMDQEIVFYCT